MTDHDAETALPLLCDQRGVRCCGTPACPNAGVWTDDPYELPVYVRERHADVGHNHSEPVCAYPDCETYLTRSEMARLQARQRPAPPASAPEEGMR